MNPAALRSLGYEAGELIGRSLSDILSPTVRPHFPRYLERIVSSREDNGLMLVVTKAGAIRTWRYQTSASAITPATPTFSAMRRT